MRLLIIISLCFGVHNSAFALHSDEIGEFYEFFELACQHESFECLEPDPRLKLDQHAIQYSFTSDPSSQVITLNAEDFIQGKRALIGSGFNFKLHARFASPQYMNKERLQQERENAKHLKIACNTAARACELGATMAAISNPFLFLAVVVCSTAGASCDERITDYIEVIDVKIEELEKGEEKAKEAAAKANNHGAATSGENSGRVLPKPERPKPSRPVGSVTIKDFPGTGGGCSTGRHCFPL